MRTYVTAPTMRPAACLALNTCESFPGLLRELREMKKNAKGWKIAKGSEICEGRYDSCLWDKTRTRGTVLGQQNLISFKAAVHHGGSVWE